MSTIRNQRRELSLDDEQRYECTQGGKVRHVCPHKDSETQGVAQIQHVVEERYGNFVGTVECRLLAVVTHQ